MQKLSMLFFPNVDPINIYLQAMGGCTYATVFRAKHGGHWTQTPHQWVTFVREMRILPICFHRYTGNMASKIYFFSISNFISVYTYSFFLF